METVFREDSPYQWHVGCTYDNFQATERIEALKHSNLPKSLIFKGITLTVQLPSSLAPQSQKNEPYLAYEIS